MPKPLKILIVLLILAAAAGFGAYYYLYNVRPAEEQAQGSANPLRKRGYSPGAPGLPRQRPH